MEAAINPVGRRRLAKALRQLASGRMTNDQFEDALPEEMDHASREIYHFAWLFYDDLYPHRLRGRHRLSRFQRQVFARCVLFLRSDLPYEWSPYAKWMWCPQRNADHADREPSIETDVLGWLRYVLTTSFAERRRRAVEREGREDAVARPALIDDRIWPFRRRMDLRAALSSPPYLSGC